eukprot:c29338_g2_i2 orf=344-2116(-)
MINAMDQGSILIDQILTLVVDDLQVVSYKWLSRKFLIPSNAAKRLLQEFVNQHGDSVEVVYAISGWTKSEPRCYSIQLVPRAKLQQAQELVVDDVNIHIYSVQPCLPKDPAELWSAEYVQSEELFNEPPDVNNCLRDNRFSAVLCLSATRNLKGKVPSVARPSSPKASSSHISATANPPVAHESGQSVPHTSPADSTLLNLKPGVNAKEVDAVKFTHSLGLEVEADGSDANPGKVVPGFGPVLKGTNAVHSKKKLTGDSGQGGVGSLTSLWNRASSKPKQMPGPSPPGAQLASAIKQPLASAPGDAEACLRVVEAACDVSSGDDDDDAADFACVRRGRLVNGNGRKRRVVLEDEISDEENEEVFDSQKVVRLASPELPKQRINSTAELHGKDQLGGRFLDGTKKGEGKKDTRTDSGIKDVISPVFPSSNKHNDGEAHGKANGLGLSDDEAKLDGVPHTNLIGIGGLVQEVGKAMHKPEILSSTDVGTLPKSAPKKRKVLKTHIDDHGREVTEVVWEMEAEDVNHKIESPVKPASAPVQNAESKPPHSRQAASGIVKSLNPANKGSGKSSAKTAGKDSQQGKILSFFKKKN